MKEARFIKLFVWVNGAVPAALLLGDAFAGRLGANPGNCALLTTGILTIFFLTLSLAVTPLRKITGWNWLIFSRRVFGLLAFYHACAHVTFYVINKHAGSISAALNEIIHANYLIIGSIALLSMIPLALTSTDGMIKRLGGKRWQLLHRLAYLSAVAGAVHFCLQGKIVRPLAWLYLGIIGGLLVFRIGRFLAGLGKGIRPLPIPAPMTRWSGQLRVESITQETPNVRTFRLVPLPANNGDSFPFTHLPGQYLTVALPIDDRTVYRCYTIASPPPSPPPPPPPPSAPPNDLPAYCAITTKREEFGRASRHMHDNLAVGSLISVTAPAGHFTFTGEGVEGIALVAGGVGITPLMSILRHLTARAWPGEIYLVYSNRTESDIIFREELEDLARRFPNFHLTLTVTREISPAWSGQRGRIDAALLTSVIPDLAKVPVYVCGPAEMLSATRALLLQLCVPPGNIHTESFGVKPTAPPTVEPAGSAMFDVAFARSQKTAPIRAGQPILELAERLGIPIDFSCRSGICGTCKCALLSGSVVMETEDALTPADRAQNLILLCQAKATSDVTVEV